MAAEINLVDVLQPPKRRRARHQCLLNVPLTPLTAPRRIVDGFGNILRRLETIAPNERPMTASNIFAGGDDADVGGGNNNNNNNSSSSSSRASGSTSGNAGGSAKNHAFPASHELERILTLNMNASMAEHERALLAAEAEEEGGADERAAEEEGWVVGKQEEEDEEGLGGVWALVLPQERVTIDLEHERLVYAGYSNPRQHFDDSIALPLRLPPFFGGDGARYRLAQEQRQQRQQRQRRTLAALLAHGARLHRVLGGGGGWGEKQGLLSLDPHTRYSDDTSSASPFNHVLDNDDGRSSSSLFEQARRRLGEVARPGDYVQFLTATAFVPTVAATPTTTISSFSPPPPFSSSSFSSASSSPSSSMSSSSSSLSSSPASTSSHSANPLRHVLLGVTPASAASAAAAAQDGVAAAFAAAAAAAATSAATTDSAPGASGGTDTDGDAVITAAGAAYVLDGVFGAFSARGISYAQQRRSSSSSSLLPCSSPSSFPSPSSSSSSSSAKEPKKAEKAEHEHEHEHEQEHEQDGGDGTATTTTTTIRTSTKIDVPMTTLSIVCQ
jgi:hypothetical protein